MTASPSSPTRSSARSSGSRTAPAFREARIARLAVGRQLSRSWLSRRTTVMATTKATTVDAGGRELRVSNPDRVIFPRGRALGRGHQARHRRVLRRGRRRHPPRPEAPADHARALAEGRPSGHRPVHPREGRWRRLLPEAHPAGAPDYVETARIEFPSGRRADEICPTEWRSSPGAPRWAPSRSIHGRCAARTSTIRTSCVSTSTRTGHGLPGRRARRRRGAGAAGRARQRRIPQDLRRPGIHIYVRIEPRWTFTDVRHAAIAFGRELERRMPDEVTTKWWKEERGEHIFVDYNQNARDRTIASAYSIRPEARRAGLDAADLGRARRTRSRRISRSRPCPPASPRWATATPRSTTSPTRSSPCWTCTSATRRGDMPYPPDYPKMPGEPKRVQPSRDRDRKRD